MAPSRVASCAVACLSLLLAACSGGSSAPSETTNHDGGSVDARASHDARADRQAAHSSSSASSSSSTSSRDAGPSDAPAPVDVYVPSRMPGQRTPLSAACDPVDPTRCLTPWPNNTFTVVDTSTTTGLRVNVSPTGLISVDSPASLNRADGFSRVSPIETGFAGPLDPTTFGDKTTGGVRLIVEQPGATFGQLVPLRFDTVRSSDMVTSLLIAYPRVPLAPNTDYAVVVMNSVKTMAGDALAPDRLGQVALGLAPPATADEGALYAYDAPARAAMKAAGVDPTQGVRVWDFTTRSLNDPTSDLITMRDFEIAAFDSSPFGGDAGVPTIAGEMLIDGGLVVDAGDGGGPAGPVGIAIDSISTTPTGAVAMAVIGRVTGVPNYLSSTGTLNRGPTGAPVAVGVHDVPFRAAIPVGTGDYRVVMYGHGTGGSYDETSFDQEITSNGATKIGTQFLGWTGAGIGNTFALFTRVIAGADVSSAGLTQSLADTELVQHALGGSLGTLLGAPVLAGLANPAVGRHPNVNEPVWAGGSLGGTMGYVYSAVDPDITAAVLNVPGAAWSQFVVYSYLFQYVRLVMDANYPDLLDVWLGVAEAQINFDPVDGAIWHDAVGTHLPILLEQESMGDPVLPNIGNEMVAASSGADQVGVVLNPIATCTNVPQVASHNGMTQFRVPSSVTAPLSIHGFAANDTPAGVAAQQQIISFIGSVWSGAPLITVPPECVKNTPANSCDFSADNDAGQ